MRAKVFEVSGRGGSLRGSWLGTVAVALAGCSGDHLILGGGGTSGCVPGSYAGSYACAADAGISIVMSGPLTLVLEGDQGGPALYVAPATTFSSTQAGETVSAPVTGSLDCRTYELTASIGDLDVSSSTGHLATFYQRAAMTARYDADASPPALVMGTMASPQIQPGLSGSCTWSAVLK